MGAVQIVIVLVPLIAGVLIIASSVIKQKKHARKKSMSRFDPLFLRLYKRLYQFPLTGDRIRKITMQIQSMAIYGKRQSYVKACVYFMLSSGTMVVLIIASIFFFQDAICILLCMAFAVVFSTVLIDKKVDKINLRVYEELRVTISSLRQEYMKMGNVVEALQECEVGYELRNSIDEILNIITNSNGELRLQEFFQKTPFRPLQTLARMCYNVNNIGDEKDVYGQSNLVQALTLMSTDINSELERIRYQKSKFGVIEYLPLVPIPIIGIIEGYFTNIMPGTALIYEGMLGYVMRVSILVSAIVCYSTVSKINNIQSIQDDDRCDWSMKLLEIGFIHNFIAGMTPRNRKKAKVKNKLKLCLSKKTLEQLYTEKTVFAIVAFTLSIITLVSTAQLGRQFLMNSVQQLSLVATDEMNNFERQAILEMDGMYIDMCDSRGEVINDSKALDLVNDYMGKLTDLQKLDQVKRMKDKYTNIKSSYFHWYFMIICFFIGVIGWMYPNVNLKIRKFLVKTESEEDFLQLQTLMTVIMNSNCDTLDALEQLTDISRIHKDILLYCYHSFPSNPELELSNLERKTSLLEFRRFVGKLKLTVNDLSLSEAFSDLIIERDHVVKLRDMAIRTSIDKKRTLCGLLSLMPIGFTVVGELIVPIGYLGYMEFVTAMASMNSL